jgi:hypothetical protein
LGVPNRAYYLYYSQEFGLAFSNWGQGTGRPDLIRSGDWHQVAVANSASTVRFFYHGRLLARQNLILDTARSAVAYIGGLPNNTADIVRAKSGYDLRLTQLKGRIAVVRMYKSALTDENISALYNRVVESHRDIFPK